MIARAIHKRSKRSARAFIRVNCAAIPPSLIASELFGHEKGAFTGALQRRLGRFALAEGGTIFLDEVGDLPAETQIALWRVLQEREIERVGGSQPIAVDVRVLAATNRDLKAAVAAGAFRQDLFYRLNVFAIQVPSLRERMDDIHLLVEYFIERYGKTAGKKFRTINKKTLDLFQAYDWPGNIRELQNVIERAVILCDGDTFSVDETWLKRESRQVHGPASFCRDARRARKRNHRSRAGKEPWQDRRAGGRGYQARNPAADARVKNQELGNRQAAVQNPTRRLKHAAQIRGSLSETSSRVSYPQFLCLASRHLSMAVPWPVFQF